MVRRTGTKRRRSARLVAVGSARRRVGFACNGSPVPLRMEARLLHLQLRQDQPRRSGGEAQRPPRAAQRIPRLQEPLRRLHDGRQRRRRMGGARRHAATELRATRGWWLPGPQSVPRPTTQHGEDYSGKQVGFRCGSPEQRLTERGISACASADARRGRAVLADRVIDRVRERAALDVAVGVHDVLFALEEHLRVGHFELRHRVPH